MWWIRTDAALDSVRRLRRAGRLNTLSGLTASFSLHGAQISTAVDATSIIFKDSSGAEIARATLRLTFSTGPPPQIALSVVPTGDVSNIQVGDSPAAVTATAVAPCP